ncbi:cytoskeletal protein RodZ [Arthrobacter sp. PvP102]|uniref:aggregation-promoting factor C-terminal-like domain-containing protein n=1 Tax=unclassified Arthrobacter TaxID=235627 RepID=UPI001AE2A9B9|nr:MULTISPECIES: hypothetical protein [unclassified Arthrobacter]MBP1234195.1 cytoskeletal protein RodZ [Arthrobacter sp. PvP103]MBP1239329.1 cytoskeletal protein RodZ [Arthrobacter sp. PvP102]
MTKSTPEVRPEPASRKSAAPAQRSRHRAEPAAKVSPLSRFAASLQGSGRRAAVVTTACAVLIGVGAAGQASEPVGPATSATGAGSAATTADAESKLAFEKILVSAMPAPSSVSVNAQSSGEKPSEETAPEAPAAAPAPAPAAAPQPAPAPAPPVAVDDPAAAQAYAASQLGTYGWAADQMQCLTTLWTKESDWKTTATNASSGAYGIVQSLPAEKMASAGSDYLTNFRTQINWGLNYVKERYGSPCGALDFHYANNWY